MKAQSVRRLEYCSKPMAMRVGRALVFWRVTGGGVKGARSYPEPVQTGHGRVWWVLMVRCFCLTLLKRKKKFLLVDAVIV